MHTITFPLPLLASHTMPFYPDFGIKTYFKEVCLYLISEGSKGITHYLGDKNRFDVSSEGPSSGITLIPDEGPSLETSNLFLSPR